MICRNRFNHLPNGNPHFSLASKATSLKGEPYVSLKLDVWYFKNFQKITKYRFKFVKKILENTTMLFDSTNLFFFFFLNSGGISHEGNRITLSITD